ncbi:MAG: hypothetical protein AB7N76_07440 [Planctomycetota bacterium]
MPEPRRIALRPSYAALQETGPWRAIRGCPGREVLPGISEASPADLVGASSLVHRFEVAACPDPVYVAEVEGGGLISYGKPGGGFVHTLNTPEGFRRKLADLGIDLEQIVSGQPKNKSGPPT